MATRIKRSFEAVYDEHFSYIYNLIYMHLLRREIAEDLTSETFIKALRAYDKYDPAKASERTWLSSIAQHLLIDFYRSRAADKADFVEDDILAAIPCEDDALSRTLDADTEAVRMLLASLSPEERRLIVMRYYADMKNPEIAKMLGINAKAVSERYRRLMDKCLKIAEEKHLQEWL